MLLCWRTVARLNRAEPCGAACCRSEPSQLMCDEQKTDDSSVEVVSVNLGEFGS